MQEQGSRFGFGACPKRVLCTAGKLGKVKEWVKKKFRSTYSVNLHVRECWWQKSETEIRVQPRDPKPHWKFPCAEEKVGKVKELIQRRFQTTYSASLKVRQCWQLKSVAEIRFQPFRTNQEVSDHLLCQFACAGVLVANIWGGDQVSALGSTSVPPCLAFAIVFNVGAYFGIVNSIDTWPLGIWCISRV